ncbi:MAG: malonyl-[acyl-carrier protein] O-methyltransferase BioC [Legionellales bacterium]|nr:malonyl-[acyl-carrier protein] O-methyltransferase BioC [Legionellales bacterium]
MNESNHKKYIKNINNVRSAFKKAANTYDEYSILQQITADRLIESLEQMKIIPAKILDLGSGTGYGAKILHNKYKNAEIFQADIAEEMLKISKKKSPIIFSKDHFVCADANSIPFKDNFFDLVLCGLTIQWCNDLDLIFSGVKQILKKNGVFLFSSFGPDSLKELRDCWSRVDDYVHVNAFVDMHDIGDALVRNSLISPVLNTEIITFTYDDCHQLMRELKNIGANNINNGRRKSLTGKNKLKKVFEYYEQYRENNKLPATFEVIYGHAWRSPDTNNTSIPLDEVRDKLRNKRST